MFIYTQIINLFYCYVLFYAIAIKHLPNVISLVMFAYNRSCNMAKQCAGAGGVRLLDLLRRVQQDRAGGAVCGGHADTVPAEGRAGREAYAVSAWSWGKVISKDITIHKDITFLSLYSCPLLVAHRSNTTLSVLGEHCLSMKFYVNLLASSIRRAFTFYDFYVMHRKNAFFN